MVRRRFTSRRDPRSALELRRLAFKAKRTPGAWEVLYDALLETYPQQFERAISTAQHNANASNRSYNVLFLPAYLRYQAQFTRAQIEPVQKLFLVTPQITGGAHGPLKTHREYKDHVIVFTAIPKPQKPRKSRTKRDASSYAGHRAYGGVRMCPCPGETRHPSMLTYDPEDPNFSRDRTRRTRIGTRTRRVASFGRDRDRTRQGYSIKTLDGRWGIIKAELPNKVVVAKERATPSDWFVASQSPHNGRWTTLSIEPSFGQAYYHAEVWSRRQLYKTKEEVQSQRAGKLLGDRMSDRRDRRRRRRRYR